MVNQETTPEDELNEFASRMLESDDPSVADAALQAATDPAEWREFVAGRILDQTGNDASFAQIEGLETGRRNILTDLLRGVFRR